MRKVTRKSLDELAKVMPIICEERQKMYIGGTSGCSGDIPPGPSGTDGPRPLPPLPPSGPLGSVYNPYTIDDALGLMDAGHWRGGYVTGWGYVSPEVEINAPSGYQPPTGAGGGDGSASGGSTVGGGGSVTDGGSGGDNFPYVPGNTGSCLGDTYPNGGYGGDNSGALTDGVDIYNTTNFTFKTQSQTVFNEQLTAILRSNTVLKSLLSYFDKGYVHLTFSVEEGMRREEAAYATYKTYESYHIVFNSEYVSEQGWVVPNIKTDNIGYDFTKLKSADEALLVTLTHEAIHANHFAIFNDALLQGKTYYDTISILQDKGYSQEFIDIFIDKETAGWERDAEQLNANMHEYVNRYDLGVIDSALEEYRRDFNIR